MVQKDPWQCSQCLPWLWGDVEGQKQRSKPGRGELSSGVLQIFPSQIPAAGKLLGKREVFKEPKTERAKGRVTSLTARFTDAISRRDPKVGGAGVKHDGELLGRCADTHNSIVLRLGGKQHSLLWAAVLFLRNGQTREHHTALSQGIECNLNMQACTGK